MKKTDVSPTEFFKDYRDFVAFRPDRYGKATLFKNEQILVGLNCLEPGQSMEKHAHEEQSRFYVALEGRGNLSVADPCLDNFASRQAIVPGWVAWVPARHAHRIENTGEARMVLLVGITPAKAD